MYNELNMKVPYNFSYISMDPTIGFPIVFIMFEVAILASKFTFKYPFRYFTYIYFIMRHRLYL